MEYRTFGSTGLQVSAIGFGTWPISAGRYGAIDDDEVSRAINRAIDVGINCVDTAPGYGSGHSEEVVGRALGSRRKDVILVTKCGIFSDPVKRMGRDSTRANILKEVDASLRRLGTDWIDVHLVHWPDPEVAFEETAAAMDECVRAGKVRYVGVSNYAVAHMRRFMSVRPLNVQQVGYHLFDRRMEREMFPFCLEQNVGVMVYGSLAHGLLTGAWTGDTSFEDGDWRGTGIAIGQPILRGENFRANVTVVERLKAEVAGPRGVPVTQIALAWVLQHPAVSTALVGARTPTEVDQNVDGAALKLTPAEVGKIDEIMRGARGMHDRFDPFGHPMDDWSPPPIQAASPIPAR
ncbi:MAG: aldo/keto reductase [Chloroflexota bacterium]